MLLRKSNLGENARRMFGELLLAREMSAQRAVRRHTGSALHNTVPSTTATRSILGPYRALRHRFQLRSTVKLLNALDDRTLSDIGVRRSQIAEIVQKQLSSAAVPLETRSITIYLRPKQMIGLKNRRISVIDVLCGQLWITLADEYRDITLQSGQQFTVDRKGLTLITAVRSSIISMSAAEGEFGDTLRIY